MGHSRCDCRSHGRLAHPWPSGLAFGFRQFIVARSDPLRQAGHEAAAGKASAAGEEIMGANLCRNLTPVIVQSQVNSSAVRNEPAILRGILRRDMYDSVAIQCGRWQLSRCR